MMLRPFNALTAPLAAVLLLSTVIATATLPGCRTSQSNAAGLQRNFESKNAWVLVKSKPDADVDTLVEDFYASAGTEKAPYAAFRLRAAALLKVAPKNGKLHEVLAYDARLRAEEDASWQHFMRALQDLNYDAAPVAIYELMFEARTQTQWIEMGQLLTNLVNQHPSAMVRHQAQAALQRVHLRFYRMNDVKRGLARLELLPFWSVLGALDNDQGKGFLTPYPPEEKVDLDATMHGRRVDISWRDLAPAAYGGVHYIGAQISPSASSLAYLVTYLKSPTDQEVNLRFHTSVPLRAWVGGTLVLSEDDVRNSRADALSTRILLRKGWNEVLVKSAHEGGAWDFTARVTDDDGKRIPNLVSQRETPAQPLVRARAKTHANTSARVFLVDEAPIQTTPKRKEFITVRMLSRAGLSQRLAATSQTFAGRTPSSIALYTRALVLWSREEMGKALDLLNFGVTRSDGELGAFLVKRSKFYRRKKLWEKALADLRETTGKDHRAIVAEMELAGLYGARGWKLERCNAYRNLLKRWPDSGWVMRSLAICVNGRGYSSRAIKLFEKAKALEPGHTNALKELSALYNARGDYAQVWDNQRRLLELDPHSSQPLVRAAAYLRLAGDLDRAFALLKKANERDPDWSKPKKALGDIEHERGDLVRALPWWRAALERNPDDTRLADHIEFVAPDDLGIIESFIPTEEDIASAIERGNKHQAASGANTLMLLDHEVTDVALDGSAKAVVTIVTRAVNKKGRDRLIQKKIPRGAKLLQAYSQSADGRIQEASSVRGGVVRFRNIGAGSTTVIQFVSNRPPPPFLPNHYVASWIFEGISSEYLQSTWVLMTPKDRKLHVEILGGGINEAKRVADGHVIRTFTSENRAPFFGEPSMPPFRDLLAQVSLSTVGGWDEYVQWERALLKNAFVSNPQLVALAKKLVGDEVKPKKKLERLFHYVAEEIRYQQDYENTIAGVRPHACPIVLERGYGDCKDKAVLLILLAKHAGIDVDFAILRTRPAGKVRKKIPNQQFNHAIVYVPKQPGIEKGHFLDPTTDGLDMGSLRSDDQGATSLVLDPDTGAYEFHDIPYQGPEFETQSFAVVVKVGADLKTKATITSKTKGAKGSQLRRLLRDEEAVRKLFSMFANGFLPGATVNKGTHENSDNIWKPVEIHLDVDATATLQTMGDAKRIPLPTTFPLKRTIQLATRRHPLQLFIKSTSELTSEVHLPRGGKFTLVPEAFKVEHPCFTHERTVRKSSVDGHPVLKVKDITVQHCTEVSVEDYPEYRRQVLDVNGRLQDPVAFKLGRIVALSSRE